MEQEAKKWWGNRQVHEFIIPRRHQKAAGGSKIGLVQLSVADEIQASEMAEGNRARLAVIQLRFCLATLDGRVLGRDSDEVNSLIDKDIKLRNLFLMAQAKITVPEPQDVESFLSSETING